MKIYHCQEHKYFKYLDEIVHCPWCKGTIRECSVAPKGEKLREDAPSVVSGGKLTTLISGAKRTVKMPDFSKVLFFAGSISYKHSKQKYPQGDLKEDLVNRSEDWTYWDFADFVYNKLSQDKKLLDSGDWQFLCSVKPPPVWEAGQRNFQIYDLPIPSKTDLKNLDFPPPFLGFSSTAVLRNAVWRSLQDKNRSFVELQGKGVIYHKETKSGALSNSSSAVPKKQFDDFVVRLTKAGLGFPVFSLSDCNCFHNSAYVWGLYALTMAQDGGKTPLIILNFDQHDDDGKSKTKDVASLGWGVPLLRNASSGCYMSIGNSTDGTTITFIKRAESKVKSEIEKHEATIITMGSAPRKAGPLLENRITKLEKAQVSAELARAYFKISADQDGEPSDDWQAYWEELHKMLGKPARVNVFVAVDRDCLADHHTQWGKTRTYFKKMGDLIKCMKTTMKSLEKIQGCQPFVIGMDVCGLPEHAAITEFTKYLPPTGRDKVGKEEIDKESDVWDGIKAELEQYLEFAKADLWCTAAAIKPRVQPSHAPIDSVKSPPAPPVVDKLKEFLKREKLIEGWASGADNNCLLHTLYQLINNKPAESEVISDEARKWIDEKRKDIVKKKLAEQYQQLDVYGKEAETVLAQIGKDSKFKYKVVEYNTDSRVLLEGPELGEGNKPNYILWQGSSRNSGHFVPLWPR